MTVTRVVWLVALAVVAVGCGSVSAVAIDGGVVDTPTTTAPPGTFTVTVNKSGAATGSISASVGGIDCGGTCSAQVTSGTVVVFTATPEAGAAFAGWSEGCTGTSSSCSLAVTADVTVGARFNVARHSVTVNITGSGTVTAIPPTLGLICPGTCTIVVDHGTSVTLAEAPQGSSSFLAWSGVSCPGTGTCTFTVDADETVNASFGLNQQLNVTRSGSGHGSVTSSPVGISCPGDCTKVYPPSTVVTLTANPSTDSTFTGWSGACTGTGACTVTVNSATSADAQFTLRRYTLTVTKLGNGSGTITTNPAGVACGADCIEVYDAGTVVTLTATTDATALFRGWSGACTGIAGCSVTLNADTTATATFDPGGVQPNFMFVTSTTHTPDLGGLSGADAICQSRAQAAGLPGSYRAWLSTSMINAINRLGSASGWMLTNGHPFANATGDLAAGKVLWPPAVDEAGAQQPSSFVWTGTQGNGSSNTDGACSDWTTASSSAFATLGTTLGVTDSWSADAAVACTEPLRLFCFGIDRAATVTIPPIAGRKMFMTARSFTPGGGISAADAVCGSEATAAGLSGTYRALLATTTATAASRFTTSGPPWIRTDGLPITNTAAELFSSGTYLNLPVVAANGTTYIGSNLKFPQ